MRTKEVKEKVEPSVLLLVIYVMYKGNMLSRHNLKEMLDLIGKPFPDDVAGYLVTEAKKAS